MNPPVPPGRGRRFGAELAAKSSNTQPSGSCGREKPTVQAGMGSAAARTASGALRLTGHLRTARPLPSTLGRRPDPGQHRPPPRGRRAQPSAVPPRPHKGCVRLQQTRSGHDSQIFNYAPTLPPTPSPASSPLINFTILNINFPPARLSRRRGRGRAGQLRGREGVTWIVRREGS